MDAIIRAKSTHLYSNLQMNLSFTVEKPTFTNCSKTRAWIFSIYMRLQNHLLWSKYSGFWSLSRLLFRILLISCGFAWAATSRRNLSSRNCESRIKAVTKPKDKLSWNTLRILKESTRILWMAISTSRNNNYRKIRRKRHYYRIFRALNCL